MVRHEYLKVKQLSPEEVPAHFPPMPETEAVLVPKAELFSNLPFLGMTHQTSTLGVQGPLIGFILW